MDGESAGLVGTLGTALGMGLAYAVNVISKKFGSSSGASANDLAQKDMLEFMRGQLKDEVEKREKVEELYEKLYARFNDLSTQMGLLEISNKRLESQVSELSDLVASLKGTPT